MKKILFLFIFFPFLVSGQKVTWYTIEKAAELNQKEPRKFIIDVYTDWCGWCKEMDRTTFSNPVIAEYLNKYFYPVKLNAETHDTIRFAGGVFINAGTGSRSSHQLAQALLNGKMSYPSVVYMTEDLKIFTVMPGYLTPDKIEPILVYIGEEKYKTYKTFDDFMKDFKSKLK